LNKNYGNNRDADKDLSNK